MVFDLKELLITLGRSPDNQIQITHPSISSHHAEFRKESGDYRLVDLGSTNGSRVNDERTEDSMLRKGDVVMLGNILFSYDSEIEVEAPPLPEAEARVDLSSQSGSGRPADFKNLAPMKKAKRESVGFSPVILLAVLFALAGLGYLAYELFLV